MREMSQHSRRAAAHGILTSAGMSLVPLADIFNHKAAIVQLSDEYMIEPICFEDSKELSDDDASLAACGDGQCAEPGCSGESCPGLDLTMTLLLSRSQVPVLPMRSNALICCSAISALRCCLQTNVEHSGPT